MPIMCSGKKCSPIAIFFFIASVAALLLVWSGAGSLLGKGEVEKGLKHVSEQLVNIGNKYSKNVNFSHGEVEVDGWGQNKRAVIRNVIIDVTGKAAVDLFKITVSLGDVVASADPIDSRKLRMEISKKIDISQNNKVIKSLVFEEPLVYSYLQTQIDAIDSFQNNIVLPKNISFLAGTSESVSEMDKDGTEQTGEDKYEISFNENPNILFISSSGHRLEFSYDLSGLTVLSNGKNIVTIGTWKSQLNEDDGGAEGRVAGKHTITADDIVLYMEQDSTKPYALNINTDFIFDERKIAVNKQETNNPNQSSGEALKGMASTSESFDSVDNREVVLNNFSLSNPDFKLHATGKFANTKGDPLPSGEINVDIDNLPKFLDSEIVAMQNRVLIESALTKIIGQPLAGQEQASILIKRERNGVFYIGNTNFEELVASVLSGSLMSSHPRGGGRLPEVNPSTRIPSTDQGILPNKAEDAVELPITAPKP